MKISKKSWHYRLITELFKHKAPETLCGYFWELVLSILMIIAVLFGVLYVSIILIYILTIPITIHFHDTNIISGIASLVVWWFILLIIAYELELLFWRPKENFKKEDNIVVEYIKAKKQKICPLIEFK